MATTLEDPKPLPAYIAQLREMARPELFRLLQSFSRQVIERLRAEVVAGHIAGDTYGNEGSYGNNGNRCIIGHLAFLTHTLSSFIWCNAKTLKLEGYVYNVSPGETPATSSVLKDIITWIDEFLDPSEATQHDLL